MKSEILRSYVEFYEWRTKNCDESKREKLIPSNQKERGVGKNEDENYARVIHRVEKEQNSPPPSHLPSLHLRRIYAT